ncbi:MAG: hypothetical protein HPY54_07560 [Chthonomonadetes bacterium]|nr:hypothetical protein [Chthonomonadetes bacterium]
MRTVKITFLIAVLAGTLTACGGGGGTGGISDTTAPTISRVAVEPTALIAPGTTIVRVEADVTDDSSGVDTVAVEVVYPDGTRETKTLTATTGSTYAVQFTPQWGGNQPGTVRFTVSARDGASNVQSAAPIDVRGAAPPPEYPW